MPCDGSSIARSKRRARGFALLGNDRGAVDQLLQALQGFNAIQFEAAMLLRKGQTIDLSWLTKFLGENGYSRADTVMEPGEFAVRGGLIDRLVRVWAGISNAIPNFWLAVLLVLIFALKLGWFPAVNWVPFSTSPVEWAKSWILPVTAVSLMGSATVARQARAALLTTLSRDYVRTLLAAGVSRRSVLFKHALRNAAAPVLTVLGFQFIGLLGGSIIVEEVFALQGLGSLVQNAIYTKDLPIVQGIVIFAAVMVVIVNLAIDIFYAWLNPKVRTA